MDNVPQFQPAPPPEVVALRQKVTGLEQQVATLKDKHDALVEKSAERIRLEMQRVALLENAVDMKMRATNASGMMNKEMQDELEKKSTEIENLKLAILGAKTDKQQQVDALEKKVKDLTTQLEEERKGRVEDRERIAELTAKLERGDDSMQHRPTATRKSSAMPKQSEIPRMDDTAEMDSLDELPVDNANESVHAANEFFDNGGDGMADSSMEEEGEKAEEQRPVRKAKGSSQSVEVDKRRRSSRLLPTVQSHSAEDSEGETQPPVKKSRSDSAARDGKKTTKKDTAQSGQTKKKSQAPHANDTDLECPECEHRTRSLRGWEKHLRLKHSTNPALAGLALLCKCGNESVSHHHSLKCSVASFTVIRKTNGPIQRLDDEKTTPQCVLCEEYPKTPCGYTQHLNAHHNSTLIANGIFLKCACGEEFRSHHSKTDHTQKCNGRQFALHNLDEE